MVISEKGLELIKFFEGCILQSYDDFNEKIIEEGGAYEGTLSIGYGHIEGVYSGQKITEKQAEEMLKCDMVRYCEQVDEVINNINLPFVVNQNVYDCFVSFTYNLGQGCLRTLLANGTRSKEVVAEKILEYRNKGTVWEQGLLRRRQAERNLFLSNENVKNNNISATGKIAELQILSNKYCGTNLLVDNIYGDKTEKALKQLPLLKIGSKGDFVVWLQLRLGILADGIFGIETLTCVRHWQYNHDLLVDDICGFYTYKSLCLEV